MGQKKLEKFAIEDSLSLRTISKDSFAQLAELYSIVDTV
ncbi:hypothetical protein MmTuc01_0890 [Methanosarcina mazei Tuc01]|uniref:Uncharacterized protein n=1 Tax=Methanosarcina mazei Tuc01 TaxID=1236903 RepID=M1P791_METMZ|nr:hypothetical protein MmTuc01_0890 [Methanosarcina mazei Tuc01]